MTDEPRPLDVPAYPAPQHRPDEQPPRSRRARIVRGAVIGVVSFALGLAALVGLGLGALWAFDPMGDEWVCSEGEAPIEYPAGGGECLPEGTKDLPEGARWEPFGNRPMPYNCDKDGWVPVERDVVVRGEPDVEEDCVREGTDLPDGWRVRDDD
ncbi:hypothetical protein AB0N29_05180 [Nocardioides sp. NPDC092400]|uniref:hypothetical protein n=1 Tax=Nocardioides sp. NPDC092400 TaxID=3155196 RepID=UPI003418CCA4